MRYQGLVVRIVLLAVGIGTAVIPASAVTRYVTSYGAVPNDTGDDRAAINNAIAASSSGDTVYFPSGTYRVSGSITGKSGVRLEGAAGSVLLYVGGTANVILALYSVSNTTVTGLTLDGNNSANATQGIAASSATGINLQNLTIRNLGNAGDSWTHGILFDPAVTDSTIINNTITNIATGSSWGAGMRLGHGSSRNVVQNNTISNTGRGGILCNDGSTDLVIRSNTVTGSGGEGLGIELWSLCHRGLVEDNHIDHWLSLDTSDYCAVRRNTVSDKSGMYKLAGLEAISRNCVFADNLVDGGAQMGISLSNDPVMQYVLWARNTIKGCGTWGAQLQPGAGGIAYQYFYQNKFLNTNNACPPAWYPYQGHGFRFNGVPCSYISFDGNQFKDNAGNGITVWGVDHFSFTNNTITGNAGVAVEHAFGAPAPVIADMEWTGNTVSGNGSNTQPSSRGFSNLKPVAAFTCPAVVLPRQTVSFSNTSSDPDGSIGHVLWDFGDGLPSTTVSPTHTYANAGSYTVSLVVWDNLGRGMLATKSIACVLRAGSITGKVTLNDYSGDPQDVLVKIDLRNPGQTTPVRTERVVLDSQGRFSISNVTPGSYDVAFKAASWLRQVVPNVQVLENQVTTGVNVSLPNGDVNGDNTVTATGDVPVILKNMDVHGAP